MRVRAVAPLELLAAGSRGILVSMCGRYNVTLTAHQLTLGFQVLASDPELPFKPRYNVAPTQTAPIVTLDQDGKRRLSLARWGLVPGWMKDGLKGKPHFNAMGETVAEKPLFRAAFRRSRCLVPATGFYEWKLQGKTRQPIHFHLPASAPFAFAGLQEAFTTDDGKFVESFTVITTAPNELVAEVHNRMPVILPPEAHLVWLDPRESKDRLVGFLCPYPADRMIATRIVDRINRVVNDDEACLEVLPTDRTSSAPPWPEAPRGN